MNVLIVIDMQNDFIDGALGTKEAEAIVPRVVDKIRIFDGMVLATRDTHEADYLQTQEGKNLPVEHCIRGTVSYTHLDVYKRQVFGKGSKERRVYLNDRTNLYIREYLESRKDNNPALFVSMKSPHERLSKAGIEYILSLIHI